LSSAPPIDIEATFTDFIRAYGGEVGGDSFGASPDFANADYVFRSRKVVAELMPARMCLIHGRLPPTAMEMPRRLTFSTMEVR